MKHFVLTICLLAMLTSCKDNPKQEAIPNDLEKSVEPVTENSTALALGCYGYKANGSEVQMEITTIRGNTVEGNLTFAYAEKDKNTGTFKGILHEDKVIGTYTYMSEGIQSVRDLAFKVEKDQLVEGFGKLDESGTTFTDTDSIHYNSTTPWSKTDCE